jgi:hypothetical protein
MERVANALTRRWSGEKARVHYLREYYFEDQWSYDTPPPGEPEDRRSDWRNGIHDDIYYEVEIAVQDPKLIRIDERTKVGLFTLHGVELTPIERTMEIGRAFEASRRTLR